MSHRRTFSIALWVLLGLLLVACGAPGPADVTSPVPTPALTPVAGSLSAVHPTPEPLSKEAIGQIKSVCLSVSQTGDAPQDYVYQDVSGLLTCSGLQVRQGAAGCDAQMAFAVKLVALGAKYAGAPGDGYCYTGADATATLTMTVSNAVPRVARHGQRVEPPTTIYNVCAQTVEGGPLGWAAREVVYKDLAALWGMALFRPAWGHLDENGQAAALRAVSEQPADAAETAALSKATLQSADPASGLYIAAIEALAGVGPEAGVAVAELSAALSRPGTVLGPNGRDVTLGMLAAQALGQAGAAGQPAVASLITRLKPPECDDPAARRALARIGGAEATAALLNCLQTRQVAERLSLLEDLGSDPAPLAADVAMALHGLVMEDVNRELAARPAGTRSATVEQLFSIYGSFGPAAVQVAPGLLDLAAGPALAPSERRALLEWLGKNGPAIYPLLCERYGRETNPDVREGIVRALVVGSAATPEALAVYGQFLENFVPTYMETGGVLLTVLPSLGPGAVTTVPALIHMLEGKTKGTVGSGAVITTLGELGPGAIDAVPALIRLLKAERTGPNPGYAKYALWKITGQRFDIDPAPWERWWRNYLRSVGR